MVTHQIIFLSIVVIVAIQRLFELRKSKRHERLLLAQGGKEHSPAHYKFIVLMHITWFLSMLFEVFYFKRVFNPIEFKVAFIVMLIGNWIRFESMRTLGTRWTTRIFTIPGAAPISSGIYQYLRHPIYVGVALEIAAVPLLNNAYMTSIIFSILNLCLMSVRIPAEQRALVLH